METQNTRKTALVTGGTDGIGREIARGLALAGAQVVIVGRDLAKGRRTEEEFRTLNDNCRVEFFRADLSLVGEALRVGDEISKRWARLDYLVHSAGIVRRRRVLTEEGIESNFSTNYLSRFALTKRLLPLLEVAGNPSPAARILIVGGAGVAGTIYYEDVNLTSNFNTIRALMQFQTANNVFVMELARRLASRRRANVTVACLNPGVVKTNIRKEFPSWMKWLVALLLDPLVGQTAAEAARPALKLLLTEEFEEQTGAFYRQLRKFGRLRPSRKVLDPAEGQKLWELSEQLVTKLPVSSSRSNGTSE